MCESFFATLECELLARCRFRTQAAARSAVFAFVEGFYNPRRRHSSIEYLSPIDYEHGIRRRPAIPTHTSLPSCGPGRKNGSAGGRTKEWLDTGGQHAVKSARLIQALTSPRNRGKSNSSGLGGSSVPPFRLRRGMWQSFGSTLPPVRARVS